MVIAPDENRRFGEVKRAASQKLAYGDQALHGGCAATVPPLAPIESFLNIRDRLVSFCSD